ncbi:hypothetical protein SAMN05216583_106135 [Selenomonas sp. KH1T6]|nr:hypothetical protein SAMN05216583_106135 [Selenomonas ruminantium]
MHFARQVISVARKKIVFVIVEGPSDETALGVILSRLYDKNSIHIEIMYGDITTDYRIEPQDIAKSLADIVKKYAMSMHFDQKDFSQIIHLVDMDGAYVPAASIIENSDAEKPLYFENELQTSNPEHIKQRNRHKQEKLNRMCKLKKVWVSIPYQAYYMSCNLDHVLYGKLNSTDEDKENDAYDFARRYKDNIGGFLSFISNSEFSVSIGYKESWEFIKKENHSLERHTNLGLCFAKIRKD